MTDAELRREGGDEATLTPHETNQGAHLGSFLNSYQRLAERASHKITYHVEQKSDASLQLWGKLWGGGACRLVWPRLSRPFPTQQP